MAIRFEPMTSASRHHEMGDWDVVESPDLIIDDLRSNLLSLDDADLEGSVGMRLRLAQALNLLKQYGESLSVLHPLISDNNYRYLEVIFSYVEALIGSGEANVAFSWIQELSAITPPVPPEFVLPLLIRWAVKVERADLARIYLDNFVQAQGSSRLLLQLEHEICVAEGEKQLAIDCLKAAVNQFPNSRWLQVLLADAHAAALQTSCAQDVLRAASRQFGCLGMLRTRLVELATEEPALSEAFELLDQEPVESRTSLFFHRLGVLFFYKADFASAETNFRRAIDCTDEVSMETFFMLSEVLRIKADYFGSLELLRFRHSLQPGNASLGFALAYDYLAARDWARGWPLYEKRLLLSQVIFPLGLFPTWDGSSLIDRSVLVLSEQGLGDVLMAASQLHRLDDVASSWTMIGFPQLHKLFTKSFGENRFATQMPDDKIQSFQTQIGVCSLHYAFGYGSELEDASYIKPYLCVDKDDVNRWREHLSRQFGGRPCYGFTWFGGGNALARQRRSLGLEQLLPLFHANKDVVWISMQYGGSDAEKCLADFASRNHLHLPSYGHLSVDLYEQAALLLALDHTISVQQTLVHLAGAVGAPLWALLPTAPEWRYGNEGSTMPWYDSVKLFRQQSPCCWGDVIDQVLAELPSLRRCHD